VNAAVAVCPGPPGYGEAVPTTEELGGLTVSEYEHLCEVLGRAPNLLELAMVSVMWSEHCSYKSSRLHLRRLPTEGPGVLVGPGENAGVVDIGDGIAVAIRIESHNHPSAVEPYQGAATGVGGIIRDIFTMGARPIALMDPLSFGPLDDSRNRWLFDRVVGGIAGYGNSVGVPTVGGELTIDPCYSRNPLVNVFCMGVLPVDRLVLAQAAGVGNLAVLLGSTTGRDGIGGVSVLASAGFESEDADDGKRPSVQVGDPFEEKRLIEASLELLDRHLVVGIQDLGGAGLTCATSETAGRAGTGMDVDVTAVPQREPGMSPAEIMISESQERMLAIVEPAALDAVLEVCSRWEVRANVVGKVTSTGRLRILDGFEGDVLADMPAAMLSDDAPCYDRPLEKPERALTSPAQEEWEDCNAELLSKLVDYSWIYSQYDHMLFLNTVVGPGGDAAVLRAAGPGLPPSDRGLAISADSNPRWCASDPRIGTSWLVAESAINVACAGAKPVALVNCLNFGNPEHPEVMWQLSESIDGMAEACRALGVPVVGGNVSLYNASSDGDILPTPVVAVLGVIDELLAVPPGVGLNDGGTLVLLGAAPTTGSSGSRGTISPLDFEAIEDLIGLLIRCVWKPDLLGGLHDVSDGGIAVCIAEMTIRSGVGAEVDSAAIRGRDELFSEVPGRVVACTNRPEELLELARDAGVAATVVGRATGSRLVLGDLVNLAVEDLTGSWARSLPSALGETPDPVSTRN
jgi:phosphoribosylformylglycinamidine synthase subunit PurL